MSKLNGTLLEDFAKTVLSAVTAPKSIDTTWLDEMLDKEDKSLEDLLKEYSDNSESWEDKLKRATDLMNENIQKAVEQVNNKQRKILIDRPVNVKGDKMKSKEMCDCGCGKTVEDCDCEDCKTKKNRLNVANSFTASSLKESKVRLINVNKTAEKILTTIYSDIKANASKGCVEYDFMDKKWDNLLLNVCVKTVEKVLDRVAEHLIENGFAVSSSNVYDDEGITELYMSIDW